MPEKNKQRIQAVVAAMGWDECDFSLEPQVLGSTNTSYLCAYRGERYVLRLGSEHPGLLAINRKAEEAALRVVSAIGCGAELIYYDAVNGNMLTRYIEGREMAGKDFHNCRIFTSKKQTIALICMRISNANWPTSVKMEFRCTRILKKPMPITAK